jgi:hypothetical protein
VNPTGKPPLDDFEQRLLDKLREFVQLRAASQDIKQADDRASTSRSAGEGRQSLWRRRWTRPALALSIACTATAVAIIAVGTGPGSPPSAGAAMLDRVATVASSRPILEPGPGQYLYLDSADDAPIVQGNCRALIYDHVRTWISAKGAALVLDNTDGQVAFPSARDQRTCRRSHSPLLRGDVSAVTGHTSTTNPNTGETWWAPGCFPLQPGSALSANLDPTALLRKIRSIEGTSVPGPAGEFDSAGLLLASSDASPALRAAIYRAVATLPGIRLLGTVSDRLGRHGVGLALTSHGWTSTLIIDPDNSTLLADSQTNPNGQPNGWDIYHKPTIVNRIPTRAPERLTPPCRRGLSEGRPARSGIMIMTGPN